MTIPYTPPTFDASSFNCPCCGAYSEQIWDILIFKSTRLSDFKFARCIHCQEFSVWLPNGSMIYPDASTAPMPNSDMPQEIQQDYLEARSILNRSPRGSAALLRLCIQKICKHLGEKGKTLDDDIACLVEKGLPVLIQKSLDIVRVIGNNAVHPGQIDLKDNQRIANELFKLVNIIADVTITQPKQIEALYNELPKAAKEAIEKRDKTP